MGKFSLFRKSILDLLTDRLYSKLAYRFLVGSGLNLTSPICYYHKMVWLKLNYRDPIMRVCSDKYLSRGYVESRCGENILIPLIGVFDQVDEIDFDVLPDQFVLKTTSGSGTNIICLDKKSLDVKSAKAELVNWMAQDFYLRGREWCYKDAKCRIICEELVLNRGAIPKDYKVYCFEGEPLYISVYHERFGERPSQTVYDANWNVLDGVFDYHYEINVKDIEDEPSCFKALMEAARKLSKGLLHVRVDFYVLGDVFYFGELTFFTAAGNTKMLPEALEVEIGKLVDLSKIDSNGLYQP